jgi:hypothetical protein
MGYNGKLELFYLELNFGRLKENPKWEWKYRDDINLECPYGNKIHRS